MSNIGDRLCRRTTMRTYPGVAMRKKAPRSGRAHGLEKNERSTEGSKASGGYTMDDLYYSQLIRRQDELMSQMVEVLGVDPVVAGTVDGGLAWPEARTWSFVTPREHRALSAKSGGARKSLKPAWSVGMMSSGRSINASKNSTGLESFVEAIPLAERCARR
jgi:hypothetical protein